MFGIPDDELAQSVKAVVELLVDYYYFSIHAAFSSESMMACSRSAVDGSA
jgi:hypothetical protein